MVSINFGISDRSDKILLLQTKATKIWYLQTLRTKAMEVWKEDQRTNFLTAATNFSTAATNFFDHRDRDSVFSEFLRYFKPCPNYNFSVAELTLQRPQSRKISRGPRPGFS